MTKSQFLIFIIILQIFKTTTFTIDCNFRTYSHAEVGNLYQCRTTNIPTSSGEVVTDITGTHLSDRTNIDVEAIRIDGNWTLTFFPRHFSRFFPNIKAIKVYYAAIETLRGSELNEFPQLEYLNFEWTNLTTISSRLFERTPRMSFVWFENGGLERVGHDLFTPLNLTQLTNVNFYNNRCIYFGTANTEASVLRLIDNLREKCPFDDEDLTSGGLWCSDESVEELVCDVKTSVSGIQSHLAAKDAEIRELKVESEETKRRLESAEARLQRLEDEVLRLTTNPCN